MSGAYFDWIDFDDIEEKLLLQIHSQYSDETIEEFKCALNLLKTTRIYIKRIDWLVSGDDSEESFHERLQEELSHNAENH